MPYEESFPPIPPSVPFSSDREDRPRSRGREIPPDNHVNLTFLMKGLYSSSERKD